MSVKQSRVLRSKAGRRTTFLRAVAAVAYERATERLRQASAQRLRHTAGSHMMDRQVDLRYVRDNLGHESISTTSRSFHQIRYILSHAEIDLVPAEDNG